MGGTRSRKILVVLGWVSLAALAIALSLQNIRTFDYWWHLRAGQWIADTGSVPTVDPFSYTVPGNRWIDIHWLHQLGLYAIHSLGGHAAVVVSKAAMVLAIVGVLATIGYRRARPLTSWVGLALTLLVMSDRIMPRPELPTFLCLALVFALLERFERKPDLRVYWIVAVQIFWVNVHGLFAIGIAVCGIYVAAEILAPVLVPGSAIRRERVRRLLAVLVLSAAASLVNPNFIEGALYPVEQLGMIGPPEERGYFGSLIAELMPPIGPQTHLLPLATGLFALLAVLSFAAMARNWRTLRGAHPLLWVAFLYLALGAQRNLALFAIIAGPIFIANVNDALDRRGERAPTGLRARLAWLPSAVVIGVVGALAVGAASGRFFPQLGSLREPGLGLMESYYPIGAADWIDAHRPPGPICHHMADGGYLIWRLHPDYLVMVDGRLEVYGAERFEQLDMTTPEAFDRVATELGCGVALLHYSMIPSDALLRWLYLNSNWQLGFVDDVAVVFVRARPDGLAQYGDLDVDSPNLFEPLEGKATVSEQMRRMARTNFYLVMKRYDKALALWEETLGLFPDLEQGPTVHAALLHHNGFVAASEAIFQQLLEEDPDDPDLYTKIGDLRLESGDTDAARQHFDAALTIDPGHTYAMYRRANIAETDGDIEAARMLYLRVIAATDSASSLSQAARQHALKLGR